MDTSALKSFVILEKGNKYHEQLRLDIKDSSVHINKTKELHDENVREFEILKEIEREIPSEEISEDGEILFEYKKVRRVYRYIIWDYIDRPYILVFGRSPIIIRMTKIVEELLGFKLSRVRFDTDFFNRTINNEKIEIIQTTLQSLHTEQEFSMKGFITKEYKEDDRVNITELEVSILPLQMRARLNKLGRVSLYAAPSMDTVKSFTDKIVYTLLESKSDRGE